MVPIIVLILLLIVIFGALPHWGYTRSYGYGYWPSGIFALILIVLLILFFTGGIGTYRYGT